MTDQIKALENLVAAAKSTQPRSTYLDMAENQLTSALGNLREHVTDLGRQIETRRLAIAAKQKELQDLQTQVAADQAAPPA